MAKGPAAGYVFALRDPRLPEDRNIIFVGNGRRPWESVQRHLEGSSNPDVLDWARNLSQDFPEGLEILGAVICDRWHGEDIPLPDPQDGLTRVEWEILDEEEDFDISNPERSITSNTRKSYWVNRLREEGQPLLNRKVGRPRKQRIQVSDPEDE